MAEVLETTVVAVTVTAATTMVAATATTTKAAATTMVAATATTTKVAAAAVAVTTTTTTKVVAAVTTTTTTKATLTKEMPIKEVAKLVVGKAVQAAARVNAEQLVPCLPVSKLKPQLQLILKEEEIGNVVL